MERVGAAVGVTGALVGITGALVGITGTLVGITGALVGVTGAVVLGQMVSLLSTQHVHTILAQSIAIPIP